MGESVLLAKLNAMTLERDSLLGRYKQQISANNELRAIIATKVLDVEEKPSDSPISDAMADRFRGDAREAVKEVMADKKEGE